MIKEEIHDLNLFPHAIEEYDLALKNFVLFTQYENNTIIAVSSLHLEIALDYLSKYEHSYEVKFLDEISYEKLFSKFVDLRADKQMSKIQEEQENVHVEEDDFALDAFLKVGLDILTSEESAPIIKFVNALFYQAIKRNASDIHIEMHEYKGEVRYRLDGVLSKHIELDKNIMALVISRIKVISNLDISEKRIPQDGRTQIKISKKTLDIRVSILPTFYGERVVMRILMQSEDILSLEDLGFSLQVRKGLDEILHNSYGMILVTGPTGSGKSTTLHSLLHKIQNEEQNIITIEDPVEYKSNNISQIQVNAKVGLTFASGLRSILRQDPDIIMLGEIRDEETASISIQAALTGHLLFSTLHTNRAPAAITRLIHMGVEKYLLSSALLAVLAQRLVRILCEHCKEEDVLGSHHNTFSLDSKAKIYKAMGCKLCNYTGYKGRVAIGELFVITEEIKEYLKYDVDDSTLMKKAIDNGMISLSIQIIHLLEEGKTSFHEAIRIGL